MFATLLANQIKLIYKKEGRDYLSSFFISVKIVHYKKKFMPRYKRVLLKLSGESLMGDSQYGIEQKRLFEYAEQIKEISDLGVDMGIVIGGGNIFRGLSGIDSGIDRIQGDYMGMLATTINGLALSTAVNSIGGKSDVFTAIEMSPVGIRYSKRAVLRGFENDSVAIFTFGTGNPLFTTDSAAALRAIETDCDLLLKGTRVDGVYTADPEKDKNATKYSELTFDEAYDKGLKIMDLTAFTMCKENKMDVVVFDMNTIGNLKKVILGDEDIGTLIHA